MLRLKRTSNLTPFSLLRFTRTCSLNQQYSKRFLRTAQFLTLFFPIALPSALQSQTTPDKTTVMKNVDEVLIDFVVHKRKKPVLDLRPEEVVVADEGATVKLSDLRLVTRQTGGNHLVMFLFDSLDPSAAANARDVAKRILKLIPPAEFSFAVFKINQRLRLFQEFTADKNSAHKAIAAATDDAARSADQARIAEGKLISRVQSGADHVQSPESARNREVEESMLASITESQRIMQDQRMGASFAGLLALVRAQTRIRGRKLLIYFTDGAPPDPDLNDKVRTIVGAANRAAVSIFVINKTAVDTRIMEGLMQSQAMGAAAAFNRFNPPPTGPAAQQPTAFSGGMIPQVHDQITRIEGEGLAGNGDPLAGMALSTGGSYFFSEDNLKGPFRRAIADLTTYYEASYVPPGLVYNGMFHQTAIKVLRRGVKVQARAGYFAVPSASGMRPFEVPLMKVLSEQQLPTDVKFRAAVLQLGSMTTGNENTLVVEVPVSALTTRSNVNANLRSWQVSIVSQVRDKTGKVIEHFSEDIPGHSALNQNNQSQDCAIMQRHFTLVSGQYTLETVVLDQNSGRMGGARSSFEVHSSASGPSLSDLVLVGQIDSSAEELDPFEPLRYQRGRIIPNVSGQVIPGTKELSFFFLVHSDRIIPDPAMLEMQVLRDGELLGQVPLQLPKNLSDPFPYVASLKTGSLPVGIYDIRVSLSQGNRLAERESHFDIGAELASAAPGKMEALKGDREAEVLADSVKAEADILPAKRPSLVITELPVESVVRPSNEELDQILSEARRNALNYSLKLPNFLCVEITDRSVDSSGNGRWRRKDSFGELLRYVDNQETRTTLEIDGRPSKVKRTDMNGPISLGEFGHLLSLVFQPSSKAEFHWKETDALAGGTVQVFDYRVDRKNDSMVLSDSNGRVYAGFHGLAFIDSSTLAIRRITMEADDLPREFSIHAASISVDYDYVSVGTHDYLMPVRATVHLKRGRHERDLNQIVFQDYRRYGSQVKVIVKP